jgi:hypothetical protein
MGPKLAFCLAAPASLRYVPPKPREIVMAKGVYRDNAGWVKVSYDNRFLMLMKKDEYEEHGYKPKYETLPTRQKYDKPMPRAH